MNWRNCGRKSTPLQRGSGGHRLELLISHVLSLSCLLFLCSTAAKVKRSQKKKSYFPIMYIVSNFLEIPQFRNEVVTIVLTIFVEWLQA